MKIYCKTSNKILNEKNTIALVKKDQIYAYGDAAYAMYEKAPETINVTFPVISGVIADFNNLQTMLQMYLEEHMKGKIRGAEFIVAVHFLLPCVVFHNQRIRCSFTEYFITVTSHYVRYPASR